MTLKDLLDRCGKSTAADWNTITTWGARSGPAYLDHFVGTERGTDGSTQYELRHFQHAMRATFTLDISIGIAWGLYADPSLGFSREQRRFEEEWATQFPDPDASMHLLDFLYNGSLVDRHYYVNVDARCNLPLPRREYATEDSDDAKVAALTITPWQRDFFRVLNELETSVDYDSYLHRAGFKVISDS